MNTKFIFTPLVGGEVCFFGILPTCCTVILTLDNTRFLLVYCLECSEVTVYCLVSSEVTVENLAYLIIILTHPKLEL